MLIHHELICLSSCLCCGMPRHRMLPNSAPYGRLIHERLFARDLLPSCRMPTAVKISHDIDQQKPCICTRSTLRCRFELWYERERNVFICNSTSWITTIQSAKYKIQEKSNRHISIQLSPVISNLVFASKYLDATCWFA